MLVRTIAPAPSPKRTQLPLSSQLSAFDKVSAPIIKAFLASPDLIKDRPNLSAYINPVQAAFISKAHAFFAPTYLEQYKLWME